LGSRSRPRNNSAGQPRGNAPGAKVKSRQCEVSPAGCARNVRAVVAGGASFGARREPPHNKWGSIQMVQSAGTPGASSSSRTRRLISPSVTRAFRMAVYLCNTSVSGAAMTATRRAMASS
jgi:hypothetical protein